jgi:hypothetical protein
MKEVCKKCSYWTREGHRFYKCYCGDCPAKRRDDAAKVKKRKKKMKIEFKPNFETMLHNPHDYSWAAVVTNPRAYRKTEEEMGR